MERRRQIALGTAIGLAIVVAPLNGLLATGGGYFDLPAPAVGDSLDFLPGKSLGEIFLETGVHLSGEAEPDFVEEIRQIARRLRVEPAAPMVARVDDLLARARENYSGGSWCNLLHDVRDVLVGSSQDRAAAADYLDWRVEHRQLFGSFSSKAEKENEPKTHTEIVPELERRAQAASGPLKAHWFFLIGAATYTHGDRVECLPWFERVVKEFPKHPRAEIALFLQARCWFSRSRQGIEDVWTEAERRERANRTAPIRQNAAVLFKRYRKEYPQGRLEADALGWLGAIAFDDEDYLQALEYYIAQAETPGHPETIPSAVFMCEKCLVRLAENPDNTAAFALIAKHPRIAMGFTYLVLSAPEANNYDGKYDLSADVKKWRRKILPRIAAEVVKRKQLYQAGDWKPRYLAMLAQAASAVGKQDQALQLTNLSPAELERSDDLLLVRALAFQRAGKAEEAIETYQKLLNNFPKSPVAPGARLRLAFALQDNHQAGEALVELMALLSQQIPRDERSEATGDNPKTHFERQIDAEMSETENLFESSRYAPWDSHAVDRETWYLQRSAIYPNITGADLDQVQQTIDTLLNFAPLLELSTALESPRLADRDRNEVRAIIAERYLAQENFAQARKFMSPEQFKQTAENLEKLTLAATGSPSEKAEDMVRLGDAWADARGKLLRVPLDTTVHLLHRYRRLDGLTRRANGRSLGFKNVDAELGERDELRHAARWWLGAARARPGTALSARARWKALETMPKIAAASDYAEQLAREINGESVSREIYQRLRAESPDSIEAKRWAAYWSFPSAGGQVHDSFARRDANILGYPYDDFDAFEVENPEYSRDQSHWIDIIKPIVSLPHQAAAADPATLRTEVERINSRARVNIADVGDAAVTNFLDDLEQFFAEPNITQEMAKIYVPIRFDVLESNGWDGSEATEDSPRKNDEEVLAAIDGALRNPIMQPVADYLEFSRIGIKSGDRVTVATDIVDLKADNGKLGYVSRDYAGMEKMARDFLTKYPRSRKREAALFVIARSVQALSRPFVCDVGVRVPGSAPEDDNLDVVQKSYQAESFDPQRVLAALDEYDREFPHGRYWADNRSLRAMTLWRMHQWGEAIDLTLAQLDDRSKLDLQVEAAVRLANIFSELAQAEYRADVIDAIRSRPEATLRLSQFLERAPKDFTHPLRYLVSYLNDQLNLNAVTSN